MERVFLHTNATKKQSCVKNTLAYMHINVLNNLPDLPSRTKIVEFFPVDI